VAKGLDKSVIPISPIGVIHTDHVDPEMTPIQPVYAEGCRGRVEVFREFVEGLSDIEGFSHIYLLYRFHRAGSVVMKVRPFLQDVERGVFATRSPRRPNAVGLSIVKLIRREGNILWIEGADILDGTPLLDIKPYTAKFDRVRTTRNGWQDDVDEATARRKGRREYPRRRAS